jgi:hypothetical protein
LKRDIQLAARASEDSLDAMFMTAPDTSPIAYTGRKEEARKTNAI